MTGEELFARRLRRLRRYDAGACSQNCQGREFAEKSQLPLVGIWDGDGQRVQDGVPALGATGELLDIL